MTLDEVRAALAGVRDPATGRELLAEFGEPLVNSTFTLALVVGLSVSDISRNAVNLGKPRLEGPLEQLRSPARVGKKD